MQSAQRNKPFWKDWLSAGIALSQLHCCGLGYRGGLKNNNQKKSLLPMGLWPPPEAVKSTRGWRGSRPQKDVPGCLKSKLSKTQLRALLR